MDLRIVRATYHMLAIDMEHGKVVEPTDIWAGGQTYAECALRGAQSGRFDCDVLEWAGIGEAAGLRVAQARLNALNTTLYVLREDEPEADGRTPSTLSEAELAIVAKRDAAQHAAWDAQERVERALARRGYRVLTVADYDSVD